MLQLGGGGSEGGGFGRTFVTAELREHEDGVGAKEVTLRLQEQGRKALDAVAVDEIAVCPEGQGWQAAPPPPPCVALSLTLQPSPPLPPKVS